MTADLKTQPELFAEWTRRVVTYSEEVTYFGASGIGFALGEATAGLAAQNNSLHRALLRRFTLLGAQGEDLEAVTEEYGARKRKGNRSRALLVLRPHVTTVLGIVGGDIEVLDSTNFEAGDSLRIRNADGTTTESATIASVSVGTGPNGGDVLDVGSLVNVYDTTTDIKVLLRQVITEGTSFQSDSGAAFEALEDVVVGDLNPVLDGESSTLALNDKVWVEAVRKGKDGDVPANTIRSFTTPNPKVKDVFNPERGFGGDDTETDFEVKRRTAHGSQIRAQETAAFMEALASRGNSKVLRLFAADSTQVSTIGGIVLTRNGGGLSSDERSALSDFMSDRLRSNLAVELTNVVPTAVEVVADITLQPGTGTVAQRLKRAWTAAADRLAAFLDYRKWDPEEEAEVDNSDLLALVSHAPGVATLLTSSFQPSIPVPVALQSVPVFVRLVLTDTVSNETFGADLTPEF
jgi:uncharacterized phage protein gp47/JayE